MSAASTDPFVHKVTVLLPNLFSGFLVNEPVVNSSHDAIKTESENWLAEIMLLDPRQRKRVYACNFTYFCSVMVPYASREKLKVVSDWGNWIFLFDDMFDEGELTHDVQTSKRMVNDLLAIMVPDINRSFEKPVVQAHDSIYRRLVAGSSPRLVERYVRAMVSYCAGTLQQVEDNASNRGRTVQEMLDIRRFSIGVFPMYPLIEFAYDLNISDEVFCHPTIQLLETLGAEFVVLMNDILSYQKEEMENFPFNTVAACRIHGSPIQKAFNDVAAMINARFVAWDEALDALPTWGKDVDVQVHQYIQGIQNLVQANISWSFKTGRYFGQQAGEEVRRSRKIEVLSEPGFLRS